MNVIAKTAFKVCICKPKVVMWFVQSPKSKSLYVNARLPYNFSFSLTFHLLLGCRFKALKWVGLRHRFSLWIKQFDWLRIFRRRLKKTTVIVEVVAKKSLRAWEEQVWYSSWYLLDNRIHKVQKPKLYAFYEAFWKFYAKKIFTRLVHDVMRVAMVVSKITIMWVAMVYSLT